MKNVLLLVTLISIIHLSCDGRETKKENLERAVSEFNLKSIPLEIVTYAPEAYTEIVTDTIISNGINIRIKNYSLLDEHILVLEINDATSKKTKYQRVFVSEISMSNASKNIITTHISAKQFKMLDVDPFWDHATLQHVWVNQELSTISYIKLDISFINPKSSAYKLYRMSIDSDGQQTLNLIEENI